jgi:hypothetical protein
VQTVIADENNGQVGVRRVLGAGDAIGELGGKEVGKSGFARGWQAGQDYELG